MIKAFRFATTLITFAGILFGVGLAGATGDHPGLTPDTVDALIFPGESVDIDKTVHTPEIPPKPDIVFLADTTGSMGPAITNVKTNAATIMNTVIAAQPTANFAVAEYRDIGDAFVFRVNQALTDNTGAVQTAINGWVAGGGGDDPEAQMIALSQLATGAISFRTDSTPIIAWFGDSNGHVGGSYPTQSATISALQTAGIKVVAVAVSTPIGNGLDTGGQATAITDATGGALLNALNASEVAAKILEGLQNLSVDVEMVSNCSDPISTSFFGPVVQPVISGDDATFTETISVSEGTMGGTYTCSDWARIDGEDMTDELGGVIYEVKTIHVPGIVLEPETDTNELSPGATHEVTATIVAGSSGPVEGVRVEFEITSGPNAGALAEGVTDASGQVVFTYGAIQGPVGLGTDTIVAEFTNEDGSVVYGSATATKDWVDTTPPLADCLESVNPHGGKNPKAPGNGGQGQNQDGFYELTAEDLVWPGENLELFVTDDGSGTVFGPYSIGTVIKYTQDPSATPEAKKMGSDKGQAGAVDWHIIGNGDAVVTAVDGSGNVSDPAYCLVPPPPK
jgi:hypothetical protein